MAFTNKVKRRIALRMQMKPASGTDAPELANARHAPSLRRNSSAQLQ